MSYQKDGVKMHDKSLFLIVKKHVDEMDYYGLLAGGAPADEFDIETREICEGLCAGQSAEEIAGIIAAVFNAYFNEREEASTFLPTAENIKKDLAI